MIRCDICIIGAGSGGLSVAAGASQMGAKVVLLEEDKMGGDCLNHGCVPSKTLVRVGRVLKTVRTASRFGLTDTALKVDLAKVQAYVQSVIETIAPHDSEERFEKLGCTVIKEKGVFLDKNTVKAGTETIRAKYFVVATGSRPNIPPIVGLENVSYMTNEEAFTQKNLPETLAVIGGGAIGCELAQAYGRLGARVTILDHGRILTKEDGDCVEIIRKKFIEEGAILEEHVDIVRVQKGKNNNIEIIARAREENGQEKTITASNLLLATGRKPSLEGIGLEKAGIRYTPHGIEVDNRLRTSNRKVFAIGDCSGQPQFTHMAAHHAGIVIRNILFRIPAKHPVKSFPWVTFTDPELSHMGLKETDAKEKYGARNITVLKMPFEGNDRAHAEGEVNGLIKVVLGKKGHILGVTISGVRAGELMTPWVLAMTNGWKIGKMVEPIFPYPTMSEISKQVAGSYFTPFLFSPKVRWIVRLLLKLPF